MFNKYPYTDFHELNLDFVLSELHELETLVKSRSEVTEIEKSKIESVLEDRNLLPSVNWLYVACNSGSDDIGDGTPDKPFRTLTRALTYAFSKSADARVYLTESGNYILSNVLMLSIGLHITALASDINIIFEDNQATYNSRLNFRGYSDGTTSINVTGNDKLLYLDGGNISLNDIDINCHLRLNAGAGGGASNCTFHNLTLYNSTFGIVGPCYVGDPVVERDIITGINAQLGQLDTITTRFTHNIPYNFIHFYLGSWNMGKEIENETGFKCSGIRVNHCTYTAVQSHYNALTNISSDVVIGDIVASNLTF